MHRSSFDSQFADLVSDFNTRMAEERARFKKARKELRAETMASWRDAEWQESKDQERELLAQIEALEKIEKPLREFLADFPKDVHGKKIQYSEKTHSEFFEQQKKLVAILNGIQKERKAHPELFPVDANKPRSNYYKFVTQHLKFFHDQYIAPSDPSLQPRDEIYTRSVLSRAETVAKLLEQEIERRKEPVRRLKSKRRAKRKELFGQDRHAFMLPRVINEASLIKEHEKKLKELKELFPGKIKAIDEYLKTLYNSIADPDSDKLPTVGYQHQVGAGAPEEKKKTKHRPAGGDDAASDTVIPRTLSSQSKFKKDNERPKRDRTLAQGAVNLLNLKQRPR